MKSLADRRALVIGTGGLGGPALLTLASAGVGQLTFLDDDAVETSNLHRQPLFVEADLGQRKAQAAARRLGRHFPTVRLAPLDRRFDESCARELVAAADVVVDGSDNFATKFLANDAAVAAGVPLVHGGVLRTTAQLLTVVPGKTGCLRCLFEAPPPEGAVPACADAGVLGPLAGFAGALLGTEAVRLLLGERGSYAGRMAIFEARGARGRAVLVRRREGCPACGARLPAGTAPTGDGEAAPGEPT